MTERKWTEGPWMIAGKEETTVYSLGPMGTNVFWCEVHAAGKESASEAECKANAHLIAAAPDLYEALERFRVWALDNHTVPTEIVADVEYALAKARGETNHD